MAPRQEHMQHMLGLAAKHQRAGRFADAERAYRAVLAEQPSNVAVLNNLARVQQALGRPVEAESNYRRAVALMPNEPRLLANLGNALAEQGREAEAIVVYQQALTLNPAMAEVHNNLGGSFHRSGELSRAEEYYHRATALNPQFAEPLANLARVRLSQGDFKGGLQFALKLITLAPGRDARRLVVHCLRDLPLTPDDADFVHLASLLERALVEVWDRPAELSRIAAQIVYMKLAISDDPDETLMALASDSLLAALLASCPVAYAELEHILTAARRNLLRHLDVQPPALLPFACALAQQCFLNEYVFAQSDAERVAVAAIRDARPLHAPRSRSSRIVRAVARLAGRGCHPGAELAQPASLGATAANRRAAG
jgi:Tfp pilus assembly protein PilF